MLQFEDIIALIVVLNEIKSQSEKQLSQSERSQFLFQIKMVKEAWFWFHQVE